MLNFFTDNRPQALSAEETHAAMQREEFKQRILNKYQDKPYTEENHWWYIVAIGGMVACSLLNLVTGWSAINPYFRAIFGDALLGATVALGFAVGLPLVLEYAQWRNGTGFWERWFFKNRVRRGNLVAQVLLTGCVVFLSYKGAPELVAFISEDVQRGEVEQVDVAVIRTQYEPQIADANRAAEDFRQTRTWQGKLSPADGKKYKAMLDEAKRLRAEMNGKIESAERSNTSAKRVADSEYRAATLEKAERDQRDGQILAAISILTALLFNVLLFLKEKYEYNAFFEVGGELPVPRPAKSGPPSPSPRSSAEVDELKKLVAQLARMQQEHQATIEGLKRQGMNGHHPAATNGVGKN